MSADNAGPEPARPDKLSIVVFSGTYDRVHYALAMAAAAVASNQTATLFFTMGAARALLAGEDGRPGWHRLLPGEDGRSPQEADDALTSKGLGGFEELLSASLALGATVMVCEMGLRALGLDEARLRDDVPVTPGGLVSFLTDASRHGAMVFI